MADSQGKDHILRCIRRQSPDINCRLCADGNTDADRGPCVTIPRCHAVPPVKTSAKQKHQTDEQGDTPTATAPNPEKTDQRCDHEDQIHHQPSAGLAFGVRIRSFRNAEDPQSSDQQEQTGNQQNDLRLIVYCRETVIQQKKRQHGHDRRPEYPKDSGSWIFFLFVHCLPRILKQKTVPGTRGGLLQILFSV